MANFSLLPSWKGFLPINCRITDGSCMSSGLHKMRMLTTVAACLLAMTLPEKVTAQWTTVNNDPVYKAGKKLGSYSVTTVKQYNSAVNSWDSFKAAMDAASNDALYIIPVSGGFDFGGNYYDWRDKYVVLRKNGKPYDFANYQWEKLNLNAASPDLYDGEPDFFLDHSAEQRHFYVYGTSIMILENITLRGRLPEVTNSDHYVSLYPPGGGITIYTSNDFIFGGNLHNSACGSNVQGINDEYEGAIRLGNGGTHLYVIGGIMSHGWTQCGGAILSRSGGYTIDVENTIFQDNFSAAEGGCIAGIADGTININNHVLFRNNITSAAGGAIETHSNATVNLGASGQNYSIVFDNNQAIYFKGTFSNSYPGNGGAVAMAYNWNNSSGVLNIYPGVVFKNNVAERGGGAVAIGNGNSTSVTGVVNFYGGEFINNVATGANRAAPTDYIGYAIGAGGAVFSYNPQFFNFPKGCTTTFSGNKGSFLAFLDIGSKGKWNTPPEDWFKGEYYPSKDAAKEDIQAHFSKNTSTGVVAPFDNIYNNYDLGMLNNVKTGIYDQLTLGVAPTGSGSIVEPDAQLHQYLDPLGTGHKWVQLNQPTPLQFTPSPNLGYVFEYWTYSSEPNLDNSTSLGEWGAFFGIGNKTNNRKAVPAQVLPSTLGNNTGSISASVMQPAAITLTANYKTAARLSFDSPLLFSASLSSNNTYTQPAAKALTIKNSGSYKATSVKIALSNFMKENNRLGTACFTCSTGAIDVDVNTTNSTSLTVQPVAGLKEPGVYTADITMTYYDGAHTSTTTGRAILALYRPDNPLTVVADLQFDDVFEGYITPPAARKVSIHNYGDKPASIEKTAMNLGTGSDFGLNGALTGTVAVNGDFNGANVQPKSGLKAGMHQDQLQVLYTGGTEGQQMAVATVSMNVIKPAVLTLPSTPMTFAANIGYATITMQPLVVSNAAGDVAGTITKMTLGGANPSAFTIIESSNASVPSKGMNKSWSISPALKQAPGNYTATLTIEYIDGSTGTTSDKKTCTSVANFLQFNVVDDKDFSKASVTITSTHTYNGQAQTPTYKVAIAGNPLPNGVLTSDLYQVKSLTNNVNAGNATLVLEPTAAAVKLGYHGEKSLTFPIAKKKIDINTASFGAKTYDGTTAASVTAVSFTGLVGSQSLAINTDFAAAGTFNTKDAGSSNKTVTVTVTMKNTATANNYEVSGSKAFTGQTIARAVMKVTGLGAAAKTYDGSVAATVAGTAVLTPNYDGSNVTLKNGTATFNSKVAGNDKPVTFIGFTLTGSAAGNYTLTQPETGKGNINKRVLTVATLNYIRSKVYDGNTSVGGVSATYSNIVSGDNVTVAVSAAYDNPNAGSGKTINFTYGTPAGNDGANYAIPTADDALRRTDGEIISKDLTVGTPTLSQLSKVYDGTTTVGGTVKPGVLGGIKPGDRVTVTAVAAYTSPDVANPRTIKLTYTLSGADAYKYNSPPPTTVNGVITPKPLTIGNPSFTAKKEYDHTTDVKDAKPGNLTNVLSGDAGKVTVAIASAKYADANVGTKSITIAYSISGARAFNYSPPANYVTSGEITKKTLTLSANPSITTKRPYDGTTVAAVTANGSFGNVYPGDVVNCTVTANYAQKDVGTGIRITAAFALSGASAGNYSPPAYSLTNGEIDRKQLTITAPVMGKSKPYDGNANASVSNWYYSTLAGVVSGESLSVTGKATYDSKNAGRRTITVTYTLVGNVAVIANYLPPVNVVATDGVITPRQLTIDNPSYTASKVFDCSDVAGINDPKLNSLGGKMAGDDFTCYVAAARYSDRNAGTGKTITVSYALSGSADVTANYKAPADKTFINGEITPLKLEVNSPLYDRSKPYDGDAEVHGVSAGTPKNKCGSDDLTVTATGVYNSANVGRNKQITISYTLSGANRGNYIAPDPQIDTNGEITSSNDIGITGTTVGMSKTYDGTANAVVTNAGTLTGAGSSQLKVTATATFDNKNAGSNKRVTVHYTLTGPNASNYNLADKEIDGCSIIPLKLTVPAPQMSLSKTYDGNNTVYNGGTTALVAQMPTNRIPGDVVNLAIDKATYQTRNVGSQPITVTYRIDGADAGNYLAPDPFTSTGGKITARQIVVTGTTFDKTKVYDGTRDLANLHFGTLTNKAGNDDVKLTAMTAAYSDAAVGTHKTYSIVYSLTGVDAGNYTPPATQSGNDGEITARRLTIGTPQQTSNNKVYDGSTTVYGISCSGNVGNRVSGDGDAQVGVAIAAAVYDSKNVGERNITVTYKLTGSNTSNYAAPVAATGLKGTIDKRPIRIEGLQALNKTWDGNNKATLTGTPRLEAAGDIPASQRGKVAGDYLNLGGTPVATFDGADRGTHTVTVTGYTLTGSDAGNYALEQLTFPGVTIEAVQFAYTGADTLMLQRGTTATFTLPFGGTPPATVTLVSAPAQGTNGVSYVFTAGSNGSASLKATAAATAQAGRMPFTVKADNQVFTALNKTVYLKVYGRPTPPRNLAVTVGSSSAVFTWQPPADAGGSPIKTYRVRVTENGNTWNTLPDIVGIGDAPPATTITINSTNYALYQVMAINSDGMESDYASYAPGNVPFNPGTVGGDIVITNVTADSYTITGLSSPMSWLNGVVFHKSAVVRFAASGSTLQAGEIGLLIGSRITHDGNNISGADSVHIVFRDVTLNSSAPLTLRNGAFTDLGLTGVNSLSASASAAIRVPEGNTLNIRGVAGAAAGSMTLAAASGSASACLGGYNYEEAGDITIGDAVMLKTTGSNIGIGRAGSSPGTGSLTVKEQAVVAASIAVAKVNIDGGFTLGNVNSSGTVNVGGGSLYMPNAKMPANGITYSDNTRLYPVFVPDTLPRKSGSGYIQLNDMKNLSVAIGNRLYEAFTVNSAMLDFINTAPFVKGKSAGQLDMVACLWLPSTVVGTEADTEVYPVTVSDCSDRKFAAKVVGIPETQSCDYRNFTTSNWVGLRVKLGNVSTTTSATTDKTDSIRFAFDDGFEDWPYMHVSDIGISAAAGTGSGMAYVHDIHGISGRSSGYSLGLSPAVKAGRIMLSFAEGRSSGYVVDGAPKPVQVSGSSGNVTRRYFFNPANGKRYPTGSNPDDPQQLPTFVRYSNNGKAYELWLNTSLTAFCGAGEDLATRTFVVNDDNKELTEGGTTVQTGTWPMYVEIDTIKGLNDYIKVGNMFYRLVFSPADHSLVKFEDVSNDVTTDPSTIGKTLVVEQKYQRTVKGKLYIDGQTVPYADGDTYLGNYDVFDAGGNIPRWKSHTVADSLFLYLQPEVIDNESRMDNGEHSITLLYDNGDYASGVFTRSVLTPPSLPIHEYEIVKGTPRPSVNIAINGSTPMEISVENNIDGYKLPSGINVVTDGNTGMLNLMFTDNCEAIKHVGRFAFYLTAYNDGGAMSDTVAIRVIDRADAPTGFTVTWPAADAPTDAATLHWGAPANDGNSTLLYYEVEFAYDSTDNVNWQPVRQVVPTTPVADASMTVEAPTDGWGSGWFRVWSVNRAGHSDTAYIRPRILTVYNADLNPGGTVRFAFDASNDTLIYHNTEKRPPLSLYYRANPEAMLNEGTDYVIHEWGNNVLASSTPINPQRAWASIIGRYGCYSGVAIADSFAIAPDTITVNGLSVADKTYDHTTDATITGTAVLSANYESPKADLILVTTLAKATFVTDSAGEHRRATFTGYALGGTPRWNYVLKQPADDTAAIRRRDLSITGAAATISKTYDGTTTADIDISNVKLTGNLPATDIVLVTDTAKAHFRSRHAGVDNRIGFSGFAVRGTDTCNYRFAGQPDSIPGFITPAYITITADNQPDITYGGEVADPPTYTINVTDKAIHPDSLYTGDTFGNSRLTIMNASGTAVAAADKSTSEHLVVGNYTIANTLTITDGNPKGEGKNYVVLGYVPIRFNVAPKHLDYTATAENRRYDGSDSVKIDYTELEGKIEGDVVSINTAASPAYGRLQSRNQMSGINVPVSLSGMVVLSGADSANYTIDQPANLAVGVSPVPVTITAIVDRQEYIYGEQPVISFTVEVDGHGSSLFDGDHFATTGNTTDTLAVSYTGTGSGISTSGHYKTGRHTVTQGNLVIDDGYGGFNYVITFKDTSFTVKQKALSIDGIKAADRIYDGTSVVTIADRGSLVGVVDGTGSFSIDDVNAVVPATGQMADKNVGNDKPVTIAKISLIGNDVDNYDFAQPDCSTAGTGPSTLTVNIRKADVTISAKAQRDTIYGAHLEPSYAIVQGNVFTGDLLSGNAGLARYDTLSKQSVPLVPSDSSSAGRLIVGHYAMTLTDVTIDDGNNGNNYVLHRLFDDGSGQFSINHATVSLYTQGLSIGSRGYNGSDSVYLPPSFISQITLIGVRDSSDLPGNIMANYSYDRVTPIVPDHGLLNDKHTGNQKPVRLLGDITLTGKDAGNYNLERPDDGTFTLTVTPAHVKVAPYSGQSSYPYGTPIDTHFNFEVDNLPANTLYDTDHFININTMEVIGASQSSPLLSTAGYNRVGKHVLTRGNLKIDDGHANEADMGRDYTMDFTVLGIEVTPIPVTLDTLVAVSRMYNGRDSVAILNTGELVGLLVGNEGDYEGVVDEVSVILPDSGWLDSKHVGRSRHVNVPPFGLRSDNFNNDAANYTFVSPSNATVDITPAPVDIVVGAQTDTIYGVPVNVSANYHLQVQGLPTDMLFADDSVTGRLTLHPYGKMTPLTAADSSTAGYLRAGRYSVEATGLSINDGNSIEATGLAMGSDYTVSIRYADPDSSFSIAPIPLTVTGITAVKRYYNGLDTVLIAGSGTLQGLARGISGKYASVVDAVLPVAPGKGTTDSKHAGVGKPVTLAGMVTLKSTNANDDSRNYTVAEPEPGSITVDIDTANLIIRALTDAPSYAYGDVPKTSYSYRVTSPQTPVKPDMIEAGKLYADDAFNHGELDIDGLRSSSQHLAVGKHSVTLGTLGIDDGHEGHNYRISFVDTTFDVMPLTLDISKDMATSSRAYNGDTLVSITGGSVTGVLAGDAVSLNKQLTGWTSDKNAYDTARVVHFQPMTLSGADSVNYRLSQPRLTASISPVPITLTPVTEPALVYGSDHGLEYTTDIPLFHDTRDSLRDRFLGSLTISSDGVHAAVRTDSSTAGYLNVGNYDILQSSLRIDDGHPIAPGSNYMLSFTHTSFTVVPDTLTTLGITAANRTYNGSDTVAIDSRGRLIGIRQGRDMRLYPYPDNVKMDVGDTALMADPNVDAGKPVSLQRSISLTGRDAANYTVAMPDYITVVISPAPLTVTVGYTNSRKIESDSLPYGTKVYPDYTITEGRLFNDDHIEGTPTILGDSSRFGHWNEGRHAVTGDNGYLRVVSRNSDTDYTLTVIDTAFIITLDPDADDDGDGVPNGEEISGGNNQPPTDTDPENPDTDGDGYSDGQEHEAGTDPNDPASYPGAGIENISNTTGKSRGDAPWEVVCPESEDGEDSVFSVDVTVSAAVHSRIIYNGSQARETSPGTFIFSVAVNRPGLYHESFTVSPPSGKPGTEQTVYFTVEKLIPFNKAIAQKFDNALLVDKVSLRNMGFGEISSYQWYRNSEPIVDGSGNGPVLTSGTTVHSLLDPDAYYSLAFSTVNGDTLHSCRAKPVLHLHNTEVKAYPNPVVKGEQLTISINTPSEEEMKTYLNETIRIYSIDGHLVKERHVTGELNVMELELPEGVYLIHLKNSMIKIVVESE